MSLLSPVHAGAAPGEPGPSLAELFTDDAFLTGCVRLDGGTVVIEFDDTYESLQTPLAEQIRSRFLRSGAAGRVVLRQFDSTEDPGCSGTPPAPLASGELPRVTLYVTLYKATDGEFDSAEVVIRRGGLCQRALLVRGGRPETCSVTATKRLNAPAPTATQPVAPGPRIWDDTWGALDVKPARAIGLATGASTLGALTLALWTMYGAEPDNDALLGTAITSSIGLFGFSIGAGAAWQSRKVPSRRAFVGRTVAAGLLLVAGLGASLGVSLVGRLDSPVKGAAFAAGEAGMAVGGGLLSSVISAAIRKRTRARTIAGR